MVASDENNETIKPFDDEDDKHMVENSNTSTPFLNKPIWTNLLLPLVKYLVLAVTTACVVKYIESSDKTRQVGIAAKAEIIKDDIKRLRDLSTSLRRFNEEYEAAVLSRAEGRPAEISQDASDVLSHLDDAMYYSYKFNSSIASKAAFDHFHSSTDRARVFIKTLYYCLSPTITEKTTILYCKDILTRYYGSNEEGNIPDNRGPAPKTLALYLVDEATLALVNLLP